MDQANTSGVKCSMYLTRSWFWKTPLQQLFHFYFYTHHTTKNPTHTTTKQNTNLITYSPKPNPSYPFLLRNPSIFLPFLLFLPLLSIPSFLDPHNLLSSQIFNIIHIPFKTSNHIPSPNLLYFQTFFICLSYSFNYLLSSPPLSSLFNLTYFL